MPNAWSALDPKELRLLLAEVFGGPGQYDGVNKNRLYLPMGELQARVILNFRGVRISTITRGPAFDADQWAGFAAEVQSGLIDGPLKIGREISFASQFVQGSWKGELSGVQISPPPDGAPLPP